MISFELGAVDRARAMLRQVAFRLPVEILSELPAVREIHIDISEFDRRAERALVHPPRAAPWPHRESQPLQRFAQPVVFPQEAFNFRFQRLHFTRAAVAHYLVTVNVFPQVLQ